MLDSTRIIELVHFAPEMVHFPSELVHFPSWSSSSSLSVLLGQTLTETCSHSLSLAHEDLNALVSFLFHFVSFCFISFHRFHSGFFSLSTRKKFALFMHAAILQCLPSFVSPSCFTVLLLNLFSLINSVLSCLEVKVVMSGGQS